MRKRYHFQVHESSICTIFNTTFIHQQWVKHFFLPSLSRLNYFSWYSTLMILRVFKGKLIFQVQCEVFKVLIISQLSMIANRWQKETSVGPA